MFNGHTHHRGSAFRRVNNGHSDPLYALSFQNIPPPFSFQFAESVAKQRNQIVEAQVVRTSDPSFVIPSTESAKGKKGKGR